jgi:hypothetical protein
MGSVVLLRVNTHMTDWADFSTHLRISSEEDFMLSEVVQVHEFTLL